MNFTAPNNALNMTRAEAQAWVDAKKALGLPVSGLWLNEVSSGEASMYKLEDVPAGIITEDGKYYFCVAVRNHWPCVAAMITQEKSFGEPRRAFKYICEELGVSETESLLNIPAVQATIKRVLSK